MDWLRDTYSAPCRFHDDPTAPLARVRWYFTEQDFETHESVINSKHWQDAGERNTVVGEQWIYPPKPKPHEAPIGLTGGHECGEISDFENGQPWPYTGPPIEYDEDGIPTCCPRYYGLTCTGKPDSEVTTGPVQQWGDTCCDAVPADLDTVYLRDVPPTTSIDDWWQWILPAGNYTLHKVGSSTGWAGINQPNFQLSYGPACNDMIFSFPERQADLSFTLAVASVVCVEVTGRDSGLGAWYTLQMTSP